MKNLLIILFVGSIILFPACSNDFLHNESQIKEQLDTLVTMYIMEGEQVLTLNLSKQNDGKFTIVKHPKFFEFNSMTGKLIDGKAIITYHLSAEEWAVSSTYSQEAYETQLLLDVDNYGLVACPVNVQNSLHSFNGIRFSDDVINFDTTEMRALLLYNDGNNPVCFNIFSKPSEISLSNSSGTIIPNSNFLLTFMLNREGLSPGEYSTSIGFNIENYGDVTIPVYFKVDELKTASNTLIEGMVVEADFNSNENKLFILTSTPNRLTIIDLDDSSKTVIDLPKKPSCMDFSSDFSSVFIGNTIASFLHIDIAKNNQIREYELPIIPYDLEYGENGYCYITTGYVGYTSMICSVSLTSGNVFSYPNQYKFDEYTKLIKVPEKDLLLGYTTHLSPSRIILFDLSNDTISDRIKSFENTESAGGLWLVDNGNFSVSKQRDVRKITGNYFDELSLNIYGTIDGITGEIAHVSEHSGKSMLNIVIQGDYTSNTSWSYILLWDFNSASEITKIFPSEINNFQYNTVRYSFLAKNDNTLVILSTDSQFLDQNSTWYYEFVSF